MINLQISNHSTCGELGKAYIITHRERGKMIQSDKASNCFTFYFHITELQHSQDLKQRIKHVAIIILGQEM